MVALMNFGNRKQVGLRRRTTGGGMTCGVDEAMLVAIETANTHPEQPIDLYDLENGHTIGTVYPDISPDEAQASRADPTPYDDGQTVDTSREIVSSIDDPRVRLRFPPAYLASTARPIAQQIANQTGKDIEMVEIDTGKVMQTFRRRNRK
jgi:hypothetical protein